MKVMTAELTTPHGAEENHRYERKSLRKVTGSTADWPDLARSCVCFANASGGQLLVGIEDEATDPPTDQRVDTTLPDRIAKRISELTVNVQIAPELRTASNGGEYVLVTVVRSHSVASTSDGRYFIRIGDSCQPVGGDDVLRLLADRSTTPWEAMLFSGGSGATPDPAKLTTWCHDIRASDRVKANVKEKADAELLEHYGLAVHGALTNLGVLLLGTARDRACLGSAPIVQVIKYDERGQKVNKWLWDDNTVSPTELIDDIWATVPDFRESYELPDGMFRITVPAFEEKVIRELLVNALVHRPYTQRGDIFLNLHPDCLEVVNPGRLPLGVTPQNILHESRRRNEALARVFHDLGRMEKEGTGFDLMYERLLATGRGPPVAVERADAVSVTIPRLVLHPDVVRLVTDADQRYQLLQRERIVLGLLAQTDGLSAIELARQLELHDPAVLRNWLGKLVERGLVEQVGKTKATRYFVPARILKGAGIVAKTTLTRMQPHRLRALALEDLERYPGSGMSEIRNRVGEEIPERSLRRALEELGKEGLASWVGDRRWRRYSPTTPIGQTDRRGR